MLKRVRVMRIGQHDMWYGSLSDVFRGVPGVFRTTDSNFLNWSAGRFYPDEGCWKQKIDESLVKESYYFAQVRLQNAYN